MTGPTGKHFAAHYLSSATYLHSEGIVIWQQCYQVPYSQMQDQAAAPQNQKLLKISLSRHLQMVKYSNQNFLTSSPHWSRSAHPHIYLHYGFLKSDIFVICAWEMCCLRDSRAKRHLLGFLIVQLSLLEPRRKVFFCYFRALSGEHRLLRLVCLPWGLFDAQTQLENSHFSNHDWHRTLKFFFPFLVWTMEVTKGAGLLQFIPFLKPLWAPLHVPWFNPNQQPCPRQPHIYSTTSQIREKIRKEKDRKLMSWDKKCLIGKEKAAHRS